MPRVLGDGHSPSGRYRYGDITVAVSPTPGLLADREYLLALRDPLAGTGALNWSAGTAVSQWEGVTAEGSPPRVTELRLSGLGLTEMWGWLGDLTELRELWLDGNALTGGIPSKLVTLDKLTHLHLGGLLVGCVPPPLLAVPNNNLDQVSLRPCPSVPLVSRPRDAEGLVFRGGWQVRGAVGGFEAGGAGIYRWHTYDRAVGGTVFDVPPRAWLAVGYWEDDFFAGDWAGLGPGEYYGTCLENPTVSATILAALSVEPGSSITTHSAAPLQATNVNDTFLPHSRSRGALRPENPWRLPGDETLALVFLGTAPPRGISGRALSGT